MATDLDITTLAPPTMPDHLLPAWVDYIRWAMDQEGMLYAYRLETGDQWAPARTPIDQMIDDATGRGEQFIKNFISWLNPSFWEDDDASHTP